MSSQPQDQLLSFLQNGDPRRREVFERVLTVLDARFDDFWDNAIRAGLPMAEYIGEGLSRLADPPIVELGDFRINATERIFVRGIQEIELGPREFDVMLLLMRRAGEVVAREDIIRAVWLAQLNPMRVDEVVSRLRRKIWGDNWRRASGYVILTEQPGFCFGQRDP